MQEDIELIVEPPKRRAGGFSLAVAVSLIFHAFLIVVFLRAYQPPTSAAPEAPITRYVELIKQNPQQFVEAPGPKVDSAPLSAPFSDANRRASMPHPTGENPTTRPGDGRGLYTPPMSSGRAAQQSAGQAAQQAQPAQSAANAAADPGPGSSRIPALRTEAGAAAGINWRSAIKEVGQVASIAGSDGIDLSGVGGGEKGTAETGPLSFETQWYDWGEYAQSMVSKIRVHWYENMPMLIRTGMKGVVTIRFTIQRSGRITDVQLLNGSGVPPYDFAARKAIELASPLNPLPKDFPNPTERVTAMFYYNMEPPTR